MADYISTLTGVQMDNALLDMAEHNSEAYAVGERAGVPVDTSDVTYHNNSRYYAQLATSAIVGDATSAVRWDTDQSTALTDAQKAVARNNIDAGKNGAWTNPNLLDNPWFTVNQRGLSTYTLTGNAYLVDRWKSSGGNTITVSTNGIRIVSGTGTHQNLIQGCPIIGDLLGRTVTVSVMSQTGEISSVTFTLPSSISSGSYYDGGYGMVDSVALRVLISNTYSGLPSGYAFWLYSSSTAQTVTYRAVKLEVGSVSTLANDTPPDYGEELTRCIYSTADPADTYANNGFGRTNPNLLDNPWWGSNEVVNQRQISSGTTTANMYALDRWVFSYGTTAGEYSLGAGGLTILGHSGGMYVVQRLEPALKTALTNKTVTMSALLSDGTIISGTGIYTGESAWWYSTGGFRLGVSGQGNFQVRADSGYSFVIRAVKMELGSYSTLVNDTPPNYAEELAKCQRYFQRITTSSGMAVGYGYMSSTTNARVTVPTTVPLRAIPTVSVGTIGDMRVFGGTSVTPTAAAVQGYGTNGVGINFTVPTGISVNNAVALMYSTNSPYIDLSADL